MIKSIVILCISMLGALVYLNPAHADPANLVAEWEITANGFPGKLKIDSVDKQGNLKGIMQLSGEKSNEVIGLWDEHSQKIIFMRIGKNPSSMQMYTGYLFVGSATFCPNTELQRMMAGTFEALPGGGGTAARSIAGWAARFCGVK